jgi:hypothetical protein
MPDSNPQLRTLHLALETLGGKTHLLAEALKIPEDELGTYLRGEKLLPNPLFMAILDIVAYGQKSK